MRHGKARNQFTIRFAPVIYLAGIFVGSTGGSVGLGVAGSISAIVLANLLVSIGTGLCAAMGPRLGMPQIPMGRASFGQVGNHPPAGLPVLVFVGYYTVGVILGAEIVGRPLRHVVRAVIVIIAALSIGIGMYVHSALHLIGRWTTYISMVVLAAVSVHLIAHGPRAGAESTLSGSDYMVPWLLQFTVVFGYKVSWGPFASDYSRYLTESTSAKSIFGWASSGLFAATTWMMVLGAGLISLDPGGDVIDAFALVLPNWLLVITLLTLGLSAIPHNSVNLYSGAMAALTCNLSIRQGIIVVIAGVFGGILGLMFGGEHFQQNFALFLHVISYYITPWLAILLVTFFKAYRVGSGPPPVEEFYDHSGAFAGISWPGLGALLSGIVMSVPFMGNELYMGPIADQIGGVDLSYFVSGLVAAMIYLAFAKPVRATEMSSRARR